MDAQKPIETDPISKIESNEKFLMSGTPQLVAAVRKAFTEHVPPEKGRSFEDALRLAISLHIEQKDRPDGPYVNHILRVTLRLIEEFGITDPEMLIASLMHDSVEDPATGLAQSEGLAGDADHALANTLTALARKFGDHVKGNVAKLTNPEKKKDKDVTISLERKSRIYLEHVRETLRDPKAAIIKLSDFLDNACRVPDPANPLEANTRIRLCTKYIPVIPIFIERINQQDFPLPAEKKAEVVAQLREAQTAMQRLLETQPEAGSRPEILEPLEEAKRQNSRCTAAESLLHTLPNKEIAAIVTRYVFDREATDTQRLLLDRNGARTRVMRELEQVSQMHQQTLLDYLAKGIEHAHAIGGSQAEVDRLGTLLRERGSGLYDLAGFPLPSDPTYWKAEGEHIQHRKDSGEARWLAWNPEDADHQQQVQLLLTECKKLEPQVHEFLHGVVQDAGVGASAHVSHRVKSAQSLVGKIQKFRKSGQDWAKNATVADAVDLIGGRIVVDDLRTLESVKKSVEERIQATPGMSILRVENKFVANQGRNDPYRAIHYVIALGESGHTFELQLKTFSSMIASDLYHNAIYKPDILNLPTRFQDTVRAYNWQSVIGEMRTYMPEATADTHEGANGNGRVEQAIADLDANAFHDLVHTRLSADAPLSESDRELLKRFHEREVGKLQGIAERSPEIFAELLAAAHDAYYVLAAQSAVESQKKDQLGAGLPEAALAQMTEKGRAAFDTRYERFDGSNNKLSVEDLDLHHLASSEALRPALERFFVACGKDPAAAGIAKVIDDIVANAGEGEAAATWRKKKMVMNLYHERYGTLQEREGQITNNTAKQAWKEAVVRNQINGIATASLLTEIGGNTETGLPRDLSQTALSIDGKEYSMREMLTYAYWVATNPSSDFGKRNLSYRDFATNADTAWNRDFDKAIDEAVTRALVHGHLRTIGERLKEEHEPILVARLQKAKAEIIQKFLKRQLTDRNLAESLAAAISQEVDAQCIELVRTESDEKKRGARELAEKISRGEDRSLLEGLSHSDRLDSFVGNLTQQPRDSEKQREALVALQQYLVENTGMARVLPNFAARNVVMAKTVSDVAVPQLLRALGKQSDSQFRELAHSIAEEAAIQAGTEFRGAFREDGQPIPEQKAEYKRAVNAAGSIALRHLAPLAREIDPAMDEKEIRATLQATTFEDVVDVALNTLTRTGALDGASSSSLREELRNAVTSDGLLQTKLEGLVPAGDYAKSEIPTVRLGSSLSEQKRQIVEIGMRLANVTWMASQVHRSAYENDPSRIDPEKREGVFNPYDLLKAIQFQQTAESRGSNVDAVLRVAWELWKDILELKKAAQTQS